MRATGDRKVIGSDQREISQKRVSILPDPPIYNLTFHREPKVKQEQSCRGDLDEEDAEEQGQRMYLDC